MAHLVYYNLDRVYPSSELPKHTKIIAEFQKQFTSEISLLSANTKKTCDLENPVSESGNI